MTFSIGLYWAGIIAAALSLLLGGIVALSVDTAGMRLVAVCVFSAAAVAAWLAGRAGRYVLAGRYSKGGFRDACPHLDCRARADARRVRNERCNAGWTLDLSCRHSALGRPAQQRKARRGLSRALKLLAEYLISMWRRTMAAFGRSAEVAAADR